MEIKPDIEKGISKGSERESYYSWYPEWKILESKQGGKQVARIPGLIQFRMQQQNSVGNSGEKLKRNIEIIFRNRTSTREINHGSK